MMLIFLFEKENVTVNVGSTNFTFNYTDYTVNQKFDTYSKKKLESAALLPTYFFRSTSFFYFLVGTFCYARIPIFCDPMLFPASSASASSVQKQHEEQGTSRQRFIWGDSAQCYSGSCEFFLFCWLGGGLIEKGCGGFLFACCQRQTTPSVKSGIGNSPTEPPAVPEFYGPVTNDPRME